MSRRVPLGSNTTGPGPRRRDLEKRSLRKRILDVFMEVLSYTLRVFPVRSGGTPPPSSNPGLPTLLGVRLPLGPSSRGATSLPEASDVSPTLPGRVIHPGPPHVPSKTRQSHPLTPARTGRGKTGVKEVDFLGRRRRTRRSVDRESGGVDSGSPFTLIRSAPSP